MIILRKKIKWILAFVAVLGVLAVSRKLGELAAGVGTKPQSACVVLDAGHGGSDPGKIGVNQAKEKDINLQIVEYVRENLENEGVEVILTRTDDTADESKAADMKERVSLINAKHPDMAVSIHQNSYTDSDVKGAQVFYYTHSEQGKELALVMQEEMCLQDETNTRQAKANDTYYMLKKTEVPTIIVECGFLSNYEEAEKLCEEEYQKKIAEAICSGIIKGLDKMMN